MADDFALRYGGLVAGSCDCVDRVVLNAYFRLGHNPGGFRTWWRRFHDGSDDQLDDTYLMRMAGWFSRRVKAWGEANGVPVIYCKAGAQAPDRGAVHGRAAAVRAGVFLVLVARAPARIWKVKRSARGQIVNLEKETEYVNHYSFHILDPWSGHVTIKMSGHPPLPRRSSSTATSTSPSPRQRPGSGSARRETALLRSRIRAAWPGSQMPCRALRL